MKLLPSREEYLETILYLLKKNKLPAKTSQIAQELKISQAGVTGMLKKLSKKGYIDYTPYQGVTLTESGYIEALKIKRRHQLIEKFLVDFLGIELKNAHKEACKLEHAISDQITERICTILGHPNTCPDGNPIKHGSCCVVDYGLKLIPVFELKEGDTGIIKLLVLEHHTKNRLASFGLVLEQKIKVKRKNLSGSILLFVRNLEVEIGHDVANKIFVKKVEKT